MSEWKTDCLIIGSGIAGLSCAITLADLENNVTVITSAPELADTNTVWAQGGIIYGENSSKNQLIEDILEAGCHINHRPAVEQLASLGAPLVREILIDKLGVAFDRSGEEFRLTREAAHSENRILHRGDESGKAIEEALVSYLKEKPNVHFLTRQTAVNLLMTSFHCRERSLTYAPAHCVGAFVFDQVEQAVIPLFASHTVIATGGIGQLYLHNTNGKYSRGDGIALAHRAGCRLANLEYVQFHPTTFYHPKARRFLISETVRGEGGILLNQAGERFAIKYLPTYPIPELAPRDKVARAIHEEMLSSGAPCVFLDISHKPATWIRERFPFIYRSCEKYGVDITRQPIPVVPGAHYHCGGIWTDLKGQTSISNLWAVGEVACTGVHGANRLASTSLLEGLVWGTLAGKAICENIQEKGPLSIPDIDPWHSETLHADPNFLSQDWLTLKHTMWNYVGLIKTDARLKRAEGILTELARGIEVFYRKAALSDELIGLRHASLTALLVLDACKRNPKSLGCYQREQIEI